MKALTCLLVSLMLAVGCRTETPASGRFETISYQSEVRNERLLNIQILKDRETGNCYLIASGAGGVALLALPSCD